MWAFHRTNERMIAEPDRRLDMLRTNISRRAIRTSEEDEMAAFVRWVGRRPYHESTVVNGLYWLGGEDMFDDEDEEGGGDKGEGDEGDEE